MPDYGTAQIGFRAGDLEPQLQARAGQGGSLGLTARRDLERYYALLARELPTFTESEAMLLCDVMNGTLTEPHTASLLWANVSDALEDGYAEKWHVDGLALVARLRHLSPIQAMAVCDACERFWHLVASGDARSNAERVRVVGLTRARE